MRFAGGESPAGDCDPTDRACDGARKQERGDRGDSRTGGCRDHEGERERTPVRGLELRRAEQDDRAPADRPGGVEVVAVADLDRSLGGPPRVERRSPVPREKERRLGDGDDREAFLLGLEEDAEVSQLLRRRRLRAFLRRDQRGLARERAERLVLDGAADENGGDDERDGDRGDDGDRDRRERTRPQRFHVAALVGRVVHGCTAL